VDLSPVTLTGRWLTLAPLEERHAPDLFAAMQDEEVCRYLAWPPTTLDDTLTLIRERACRWPGGRGWHSPRSGTRPDA
jgi:Acetyltransferase (GNAT) domain